MYQNIINNIQEVAGAKTFADVNPYYVFLFPKEEDAANVIIAEGLPTYQERKEGNISFPLLTGMWNPVALNDLVVTSDMISNYRIFIGYIQ